MRKKNIAIISGEYQELVNTLKNLNLEVITTNKHPLISSAVAYHADMQFLRARDRTFVLKGESRLKKCFEDLGHTVVETGQPGPSYPRDVLCNGKIIGNTFFCNIKTIDPEIYNYCKSEGYRIVDVPQGYTGCSICDVSDSSIITDDEIIASRAEKLGFNVLLINKGCIILPGFDYGFIGGCSGRLPDDKIIFTGALRNHPDGDEIRRFVESQGIEIIELTCGPLLDVGGIAVFQS